MHDLTNLDLSPGPWKVDGDFVSDDNNLPIVRLAYCIVDDARVLAASYEMLSNTIEDTLALEPFDDGDQDNSVVRIITRNIEFLEKLLGLTWSEVKQRLGV